METKEESQPTDVDRNTEGSGPRNMGGLKWFLVVISVLSSIFLFALDNTIVADVQPKIVESLGEIDKLPWISVAFALGAVSVNLVWGKIFSQFEAKSSFLISVGLFEIGSAVCGSAPTMNALIVGRALCGVGGSGIYLGAINIISINTTDSERPSYLSFFGLTWGIGTVLGPVIGGAFADSTATWRWSFYINLCVGAVVAPIYLFYIPTYEPKAGEPFKKRLSHIDLPGTILIVGAFVSGTMAISFGGALYPWNSGQIIGLFVCSGVLWILFALQQIFYTSQESRLFPPNLLKSYEMCILFAQMAASNTACYVTIYYIPIYFQFVYGDSAMEAGVRLLPFVFILAAAVIANGIAMGIIGYYMPWYLVGGCLVVIGGALMYTVRFDTSTSAVYGYSVLVALGSGLFSQASIPVAQAKVPPSEVPNATAFIGCAQIAGIALSLTISNSIFINEATNSIRAIMPQSSLQSIQQAISGSGSDFFQSLSSAQKLAVQNALVRTISNVYIMVITAGALAVILSIFMKREKLFLQPKKDDIGHTADIQVSDQKTEDQPIESEKKEGA